MLKKEWEHLQCKDDWSFVPTQLWDLLPCIQHVPHMSSFKHKTCLLKNVASYLLTHHMKPKQAHHTQPNYEEWKLHYESHGVDKLQLQISH